MKKEIVSTDKAPSAIGPYSQGVRVDGFIFFSGQIPIDPSSGEVVKGDISIQAEQVMQNIEALLEVSGIGFDNVVKSTIFLTNLADFGIVNDIYGRRFTTAYPARSTVQVSALPKGVDIEIEVVAISR
ncbi:MAG TPA: RidA family protein [Geobacteraceae bacterium]|nr:RidA family protein [Geobacteraceae bacterium]